MQNAWRKTGYDWFAEEGNMAGGRGIVVVSDGDGDMDDDNYDDDADILEDVLGAGDKIDNDYDDDGMMGRGGVIILNINLTNYQLILFN